MSRRPSPSPAWLLVIIPLLALLLLCILVTIYPEGTQ